MGFKQEIVYSIDVEPDLHGGGEDGISEGLLRFEELCDKHNIKGTLYVVGECIPRHSALFKRLLKKGWIIGLHGYSHKRMDDLSFKDKEKEIQKGSEIFQKHLKIKPKIFRAPQHSIDEETLDLLEKYGFSIDSSYTPWNALQLLFFPKRLNLWARSFLSPRKPYLIRERVLEVPTSALLFPFVSLLIRIMPVWALKIYVWMIKKFYPAPVFYAHSWDFVEQKGSKIDAMFPHEKFIKKLDILIGEENKLR